MNISCLDILLLFFFGTLIKLYLCFLKYSSLSLSLSLSYSAMGFIHFVFFYSSFVYFIFIFYMFILNLSIFNLYYLITICCNREKGAWPLFPYYNYDTQVHFLSHCCFIAFLLNLLATLFTHSLLASKLLYIIIINAITVASSILNVIKL